MNIKRMRGRNHRGGSGGGTGGGTSIRHHGGGIPLNRNHVFESNGPEVRLRGTAQQLFEKYLQLGRDATSSGDRVTAESYYQHAEHYFRIINAINQAQQQNQPQPAQPAAPVAPQFGISPHSGRRATSLEAELEEALEQPMGGGEAGAESREIPIAAAPPDA